MTFTTISGNEPTPQERLVLSRSAIVNYMAQGDRPASGQTNRVKGLQNGRSGSGQSNIWHTVKNAVRMWWLHHPAHIAMEVAKPVLDNYAREKPMQLLGFAAGAGAAVALVRPWRMVSMTGLLFATIKSTEFSGLLLSLLSTKSDLPATLKDMP